MEISWTGNPCWRQYSSEWWLDDLKCDLILCSTRQTNWQSYVCSQVFYLLWTACIVYRVLTPEWMMSSRRKLRIQNMRWQLMNYVVMRPPSRSCHVAEDSLLDRGSKRSGSTFILSGNYCQYCMTLYSSHSLQWFILSVEQQEARPAYTYIIIFLSNCSE